MIKKVIQRTKTLHTRPNGRSADYITPNFIYGCAGGCRNSYCYVMRYNYQNLYINENIDQILERIGEHVAGLPPKMANQTDTKYWTYDIGCSTDICLHWKHTDWLKVFQFFRAHPRAKGTFATKYVNDKLLDFDPQQKVRLRFSLAPANISRLLEPKTSPIIERIKAINRFIEGGYEVHLNFSPIVVYDDWLAEYAALFELIDQHVKSSYKQSVKAECIFLTHNDQQHQRNIAANHSASEALIWQPTLQENKTSEYGGQAVRYKLALKSTFIKQWRDLHYQILPWNTIRYIF